MASFEAKVEALRKLQERRQNREAAQHKKQEEKEEERGNGDEVAGTKGSEGGHPEEGADPGGILGSDDETSRSDPDFLFCLGHCHEHGLHGRPLDAARAADFYRQAANLGHVVSQWRLGEMFEAGRGVQQSDSDAVQWYLRAAHAGNIYAQSGLALLLDEGRGDSSCGCKEKDDAVALTWHLKAAQGGHALSQYCAAMALEEGRGGLQDSAAAQMWLEKSAAAGFPPAVEALAEKLKTRRKGEDPVKSALFMGGTVKAEEEARGNVDCYDGAEEEEAGGDLGISAN